MTINGVITYFGRWSKTRTLLLKEQPSTCPLHNSVVLKNGSWLHGKTSNNCKRRKRVFQKKKGDISLTCNHPGLS